MALSSTSVSKYPLVAFLLLLLFVAAFSAKKNFANQIDATYSSSLKTSATESFEAAKAGEFQELKTEVGIWVVEKGRAKVDSKHAKTGRQCLQLLGDEQTRVTLKLSDAIANGELRFWAERWTSRKPFSFRIETESKNGWVEIFNGDEQIRVGRSFLSNVKIPLGTLPTRRLRLICTSPPETGILIDDIRIAPAIPQRIKEVKAIPFTLPALVGKKHSPLAKFNVQVEGTLNPISLTNLQATIHGLTNFESFSLSLEGSNDYHTLALKESDGKVIRWKSDSADKKQIEFIDGRNTVWLFGTLKKNANIDGRVGASIDQVDFSNGSSVKLTGNDSMQRLGVALRKGGDDGIHTFRIPGLVTTNKGTLIGVYDIRREGGRDLPGNIDVGMSRSTDGGRSWEPMRTIMDMGNDPKWRHDGIGDPAVLVDRETGTIWVAATWSHGNRSWIGSGPGIKPEETGQLMLVRSDDDGVTWSKPINITKQVKKPEWSFLLQGPGKGITMLDGTIVFPAQYQDPPNKKDRRANRLPHSTIIYSKDHGETWKIGTGAFDDTTESQVVEINPGELMLNCRYNRKSARVVMTTRDMGKTWEKHPTSELALIEPRACMASLINVDQELGKDIGGWLLFSNPDSLSGRKRITIKASSDRGLSWPDQNRVLLDEALSAGYSCMSMIDSETIGILYEGSQAHMTFQRVPLVDLIESKKSKAYR